MSDEKDPRDEVEPRACITLRLGEIDRVLSALAFSDMETCRPLYVKLMKMRTALVANARETVAGLKP